MKLLYSVVNIRYKVGWSRHFQEANVMLAMKMQPILNLEARALATPSVHPVFT